MRKTIIICYEFKKELDPIVQWLMVADCAMAESLARICIICLAIILELSPQDIVLHINVKSEIIPLVVVACGIWWKNEIGRKLLVYCHCNCSMRNNAMAWSYVLRFRCNRILSYLSHSCRSIYYVRFFTVWTAIEIPRSLTIWSNCYRNYLT